MNELLEDWKYFVTDLYSRESWKDHACFMGGSAVVGYYLGGGLGALIGAPLGPGLLALVFPVTRIVDSYREYSR